MYEHKKAEDVLVGDLLLMEHKGKKESAVVDMVSNIVTAENKLVRLHLFIWDETFPVPFVFHKQSHVVVVVDATEWDKCVRAVR